MTGALIETIGALSRGVGELLPMLCEPVRDAEIIDAQRELQTLARKVTVPPVGATRTIVSIGPRAGRRT